MKTVVISDLHIPYHDEKVVDKVFNFIGDIQPEEVIINGDFLDMYEASSFDKSPIFGKSLSEEFSTGFGLLKELRNLIPLSRIKFINGNHEHRFDRYLMKNAPQLISLPGLNVKDQLGLDSLDIEYIYSGLRESYYDTEKGVLIGHWNRVSKHSAYTAKALLDDKNTSLVQGHSHRAGVHYRQVGNKILQAVEGGCLCDTNPSYVLQPNWQQGFVIIHWLEDEEFIIEPILINKGKFVYGGSVI